MIKAFIRDYAMNTKGISILVVFITLSAIAFYFFKSYDLDGGKGALYREHESTNTVKSKLPHEASSSTTSTSSSASSSPVGYLSASEVNRVELWQLAHGYFSESDLAEYRNYDITILQKLAAEGDLKAIELVARDRMSKGVEAYLDFHHAAVRGSTHAFVALSFLLESKFFSELNEVEKTQNSIEILALLSTAGKRGDQYAASVNADSFKRRFNFEPTKEQQAKIDELSQKMYDQLVSLRTSAGLGPFDNTPSPEMKKVLDNLKK